MYKWWIYILFCLGSTSYAAAPSPTATPSAAGEELDVSKVTEKYWAQGKDSELGVVQNRKYSNAKRFEFDFLTGIVSTSPFLSVKHFGASLGYHFSEYFSLHATYWKHSVSSSDAYNTFKQQVPGVNLATNPPKAFYGLQGNWNILYGKASLFGSHIIYVDLFLLGGAGITDTSTGKNFTPFVGIGQKIHLNSFMALHFDYRLMSYSETILSSTGTSSVRQTNTTDVVTLGVGLFY